MLTIYATKDIHNKSDVPQFKYTHYMTRMQYKNIALITLKQINRVLVFTTYTYMYINRRNSPSGLRDDDDMYIKKFKYIQYGLYQQ